MSVKLKWDGDALMLGQTKMAEVAPVWPGPDATQAWQYVIGPDDVVSESYQDKKDARQDCEAEVRRLLRAAGAEA